ncbi:ABC transporter ATP-binding protein [Heyndrickxia coagulans]|uniref:ABC transporter ATP-binding protein n=1 Tax=Heyndrickxia coagulans TaxID=1398 RepID=UPI001F25A123|nr:ABC transporter ATP-binding protein [Heyndrickxia coagulans]UJZ88718.1 ABC transporter ATP-binding protein [Heyndrickxia coagulans]
MSEIALSVKGITKQIRSRKIVDQVSFEVKKGEVFGLLGPNGAGKTTIIRMIVSLMKRTSGEIYINGKSLDEDYKGALNEIGAIVENPEFYPYMTGYQNLVHYKRMSRKPISEERLWEVVKLVKLEDALKQKVKTYSLGMRQRLGVAQAILHRPSLLILDEPTNGLDPQGIREFRGYLRELAGSGVSVLVSSHLLTEMELMCDRYAIIEKGKLIHIETMAETTTVKQDDRRDILFATDDSESAKQAVEKQLHFPVSIVDDTHILVSAAYKDAAVINATLVGNGCNVYEIHFEKKTLEDRFLELTNHTAGEENQ